MDLSFKKIICIQTSACISETFTYPIDYIKTTMQINSQKTNSYSVLKKLQKKPLQMYDGLKPALFRHCIYTMLRINIYENLRDSSKNKKDLSITNKFMVGGVSGGVAQFIASPCDLIKIRYITNSNNISISKTIKQIYTEGGIQGLWKGVVPNVSRGMLVNIAELATYDHSKGFIKKSFDMKDSTPLHVSASLCSGLVSTIFCTPADVIKSRMMQTNSPYNGILNCIHKTVSEEGILSLYKGFFPIWFRLAPWQLIFWVSYERLRFISGLESF
tara:strand:- start:234 stop:1052 length:819 start_codon:yes stop_codon:yes gene_type:complete